MKNIFRTLTVVFLIIGLVGCDAFVRKFTRRPKTESPAEEMVLSPVEYKAPTMTKEEKYRQYYLFWKSWQDELIECLLRNSSHKRSVDSAQQALKNLRQMNDMLNEHVQQKLSAYVNDSIDQQDSIQKDIYGSNSARLRFSAERLRRNIAEKFSYNDIKDSLR